MTISEVAKLLGHEFTGGTRALMKAGKLTSVRTNSGIEVDDASVNAYIKSRDARGKVSTKAPRRKGNAPQTIKRLPSRRKDRAGLSGGFHPVPKPSQRDST